MDTIGTPSDTTDAVAPHEPANEASATSDEGRKRVPLMAIPITLSIGLLVAIGYVGNRIFTAKFHAAPSARNLTPARPSPPVRSQGTQPTEPKSSPASQQHEAPAARKQNEAIASKPVDKPAMPVQPVQATAPKPASKPPEVASAARERAANELLVPRAGERYLQVLAVSTNVVPRVLADLRRNNLDVRVAPGPQDDLRRLLVGPFPDAESLSRAKEQIQVLHPDCFVRAY
jgi:cell division septation protein DedD